ncbi:Myb-like_DNA-binding domain-containing protein [Hexamita inflata]|uniref:Myb-like_DNA-binding domain-containing protein n=1 Tax=Hexamita inflata TaxID=28002 RepID=A0ABP1KAT1_9EUKA
MKRITREYKYWSDHHKQQLIELTKLNNGNIEWDKIQQHFKDRSIKQIQSMHYQIVKKAGKEKQRYEWDSKEVYHLFNSVFNMGNQWVQISQLPNFRHLDANQLRLKFHFTKKLIEQDQKLRFQVMEVLKYRKQLIKSRHKDLEPVVPVEIHISNLKNIAVMEIVENEEAFINQMLPVLSKLMQNQ